MWRKFFLPLPLDFFPQDQYDNGAILRNIWQRNERINQRNSIENADTASEVEWLLEVVEKYWAAVGLVAAQASPFKRRFCDAWCQ